MLGVSVTLSQCSIRWVRIPLGLRNINTFLVCGCIRKQGVRLKPLSLEGNRKFHAISRTKWYPSFEKVYEKSEVAKTSN